MDPFSRLVLDANNTMQQNVTDVDLTVKVVVSVSCIVSMMGSLLIIVSFFAWPAVRTDARKIVVYLSVADFIAAASYLHGTIEDFTDNSLACKMQSALSTFANVSSFFWTMSIAVYLYVVIVWGDKDTADGLLCTFHMVNWGIPLSVVIAALASGGLGYDQSLISVGWCWVDLDNNLHLMWILLSGKIWEFLAYVVMPTLFFLMKKRIRDEVGVLSQSSIRREITVAFFAEFAVRQCEIQSRPDRKVVSNF